MNGASDVMMAVLATFDGYPYGAKHRFRAGSIEPVPAAYADLLEAKQLAVRWEEPAEMPTRAREH